MSIWSSDEKPADSGSVWGQSEPSLWDKFAGWFNGDAFKEMNDPSRRDYRPLPSDEYAAKIRREKEIVAARAEMGKHPGLYSPGTY